MVTTCRDRTEAIGIRNTAVAVDEVWSRSIVTTTPQPRHLFEAKLYIQICMVFLQIFRDENMFGARDSIKHGHDM